MPTTEKLIDDKPHHIIARTDMRVLDPKWGFKVNEHVIHSLVMLEQLPLPKNLKRVPEYAGTHHETLTGSGYPRKLTGAELSVPMRIMAIADIFEAPHRLRPALQEGGDLVRINQDPVIFQEGWAYRRG